MATWTLVRNAVTVTLALTVTGYLVAAAVYGWEAANALPLWAPLLVFALVVLLFAFRERFLAGEEEAFRAEEEEELIRWIDQLDILKQAQEELLREKLPPRVIVSVHTRIKELDMRIKLLERSLGRKVELPPYHRPA
jgi:hypothetical protein